MAQQSPAIKNTSHTLYIGLPSVASSGSFQTNPTLASGDFKVSKDGGALANLATLPTITPAGGKMVQIVLSANEMNADSVTIICSDASGAEWHDVLVNVQTEAGQLSFTNADTVDVNLERISGGTTGADNIDRWARSFTDGTADSGGSATTMIDNALTQADDYWNGMLCLWRSGTNIGLGRVIKDFDAATNTVTFDKPLPAAVQSSDQYVIMPYPFFDAQNDTVANVTLVDTTTTNTDMVGTNNAMLAASYTAPANGDIAAIKAKTDDLTFTKANELDANMQSVNDVTVTGVGTDADPWGED